MRTYKVKFVYDSGNSIETTISAPRAFIDGYHTARRAKEVVERTNSTTDKHGVTAEYLGYDR